LRRVAQAAFWSGCRLNMKAMAEPGLKSEKSMMVLCAFE
jgi:hypothetical protein